MTKGQADDATAALVKLQKALEDDEITIFTTTEAAALREWAQVWIKMKAVASLLGSLKGFMQWLLLFAAFIAAARAGFLDWLKDALK